MSAPIFLISGAPGAGKSTFAQKLRGSENAFIFETDNFFVDSIDKRTYHFDPKLLGIAHNWNQGEVIRACRDCPTVPVIVANTFANPDELWPYCEIARRFGRKVFLFRLLTEHENLHDVPDETVAKKRKIVRSLTAAQVLTRAQNLGYPMVYAIDIRDDGDATHTASVANFKFFQKS